MKYKVFGSTIAVRIDRGEEIFSSVQSVCKKESVKLAVISAIGAVDHAVVGIFSFKDKTYISNTFDKELELTSLNGNVTTKDGEIYLHLHANFADENGNAFGGHLNEANISGTCELFIQVLDGAVSRIHDGVTGLNLFDI